jgi:hypothetical protein
VFLLSTFDSLIGCTNKPSLKNIFDNVNMAQKRTSKDELKKEIQKIIKSIDN